MFRMLGGPQGQNLSAQDCWNGLTFGYKFFFILTLIFNILCIIFSQLTINLVNIPSKIIYQLKIWTLVTSFLTEGGAFFSLLSVLINFWIFMYLIPSIERSTSTIYLILDVITQNFLIQIIFFLIVLLFTYVIPLFPHSNLQANFGMFCIVFIYLWKFIAPNPDQLSTFCCLPCLIPMKYMPWILCIFSLLLSGSFLRSLLPCLFGYLQFMLYGANFINYPVSIMRKIQNCLPKKLTSRHDYVPVQATNRNNDSSPSSQNPFAQPVNKVSKQQQKQPNTEYMSGEGVAIGGVNIDYKKKWAEMDSEASNAKDTGIQETESKEMGILDEQKPDGDKKGLI